MKKSLKVIFAFILIGFIFAPALTYPLFTCSSHLPRQKGEEVSLILYFSADGEKAKGIGRISSMRLDEVARLFRLFGGSETHIIVTGHPGSTIGLAGLAKLYLSDRGVPQDQIIEENGSSNTWENIINSRGKISTAKNILLVSSPYHMGRILKYIERQWDLHLIDLESMNGKQGIYWSNYKLGLDIKSPIYLFGQVFHEMASQTRDILLHDNPIKSSLCN